MTRSRWLIGSISTKIGLAPAFMIEDTDAMKVRDVTITSSPVCNFNAPKAKSSATVPLATAIAYL